eukprot:TRINITY_DN4926_c0_g1_i1.p1 TRINITY_DN4926_c0_g1~~TRINITY_DN4926_c0_g1_i1.p1  ORF type:complete len:398 (-),score=87.44 TRINITY_DN4926_c0_g1_i1:51-1244(-)
MLSSFSALGGFLGGILAYGILQMDGVLGIEGWRWIFFLEGIPAIVMGLVTLMYLPDDPSKATWLSPEERRIYAIHLSSSSSLSPSLSKNSGSLQLSTTSNNENNGAIVTHTHHDVEDEIHTDKLFNQHEEGEEESESDNSQHSYMHRRRKQFMSLLVFYVREIRITLKYPSVYMYSAILFCLLMGMTSVSFLLPSTIEEFAKDPILSNLLSAIPYFSAVIVLNINAIHSDYSLERPFHIIAMGGIGIVGYLMSLGATIVKAEPAVRLACLTVAVSGQWSAMTPFMAWISDYTQGNKVAAIAAVNTFGNIAGVFSASFQTWMHEATGTYAAGLCLSAGCLFIAICLILITRSYLIRHVYPSSSSSSSSSSSVTIITTTPPSKDEMMGSEMVDLIPKDQ